VLVLVLLLLLLLVLVLVLVLLLLLLLLMVLTTAASTSTAAANYYYYFHLQQHSRLPSLPRSATPLASRAPLERRSLRRVVPRLVGGHARGGGGLWRQEGGG